jgi:large subunit ribosomal protein L25
MEAIAIKGSARKAVGKKDSKSLRNEGMVPCVIYGANDPIHFVVDERHFKNLVYTPNVYVVNVDVDGKNFTTYLKDIQFHPVTDRIVHADFFEPKEGQEVSLKIPVRTTGAAIGVLNGGRMRIPQRKITVRGLLSAMPDNVEIEVSELKIGSGVRISDLSIPGVEFTDASNNYAVFIKTARGAIEDELGEEEEEGTEAAAEGEEAPAAESEA